MALGVKKKVTWLEISMQEIGWMHVFQTFEALVNNVLFMNIFKDIGTDNSVQVRIHEIEDKVDISIIFGTNRIL